MKAKAVKKEPEPEKPDRKPTAQVISDDDDDDEEEADDIQILNAANRSCPCPRDLG